VNRLKKYSADSAEFVVLHGERQQKRNRGLSMSFLGEKNPQKAFRLAKRLAVFPKIDDIYLKDVDLSGYVCSVCSAQNCKLWRPYQTLDVSLMCAKCACIDQKKDISKMDIDGKINDDTAGKTDQIGWYVPAVPTEDYTFEWRSYWGYSAVPGPGVDWWKKLPTFPKD